jgi:hypothetical protein
MIPYLQWGMQLPLGGLAIKPKVGLGFDIYQNTTKYTQEGQSQVNPNETVTAGGKTALIGAQTTVDYYTDEGYFKPTIEVGAGVDFPVKESSQFGAGLDYSVAFIVYSKNYDTADGSETVAGTVATTNTTTKTVDQNNTIDTKSSWVRATERSKIDHTISPSFWYANDLSERVSLGFGGELDFSFGSQSAQTKTTSTEIRTTTPHDGGYWEKRTSVQIREGEPDNSIPATEEISTFGVNSKLNAGVSWKAIPNRFTLNAGLEVTLPKYTRTTTLTKTQDLIIRKIDTESEDGSKTSTTNIVTPSGGSITATESERVDRDWVPLSAAFAIGGNFIFTPNFGVDLFFTNSSNDNLTADNEHVPVSFDLTNPSFSMIFSLKF